MAKTRPPYPAAFREQIVEPARAGRSPAELSREFDPTAQSIANWIGQAARDAGQPLPGKEGLSSIERDELVRLRRQLKQVQMERDHIGKGYGLVRRQERDGVHDVCRLVSANQAELPVRAICRV